MKSFKFTVYNLKGTPKQRYVVTQKDLASSLTVPKTTKKHHIIIVDRSGSMYYDMPALKESLKKILALHEYADESMLVSLMSYSTYGDLTTHFSQKPVSQVKPSDIDELRSTGMTCISQSLVAVKSLIDKNHVTGITLHSDGFANDPSSFSEKTAIMAACEQLSKENVFVNTVSHGNYSDYQMLSGIANKVSGKCIRALAIKELYDSIVGTFETLSKGSVAVTTVPLAPSDYLLYISPSDSKIIGLASDLALSGIDPKNPGSAWGFKKVSEAEYSKASDQESQFQLAVYAFARARLAEGNIGEAKSIMASIGNIDFFNKHVFTASTAMELAEWAIALEDAVFTGKVPQATTGNIKLDDSVTVMDVLNVIDENKDGITLNVTEFLKGYKRRGVKRVQGERDDSGVLVEPWLETEVLGEKSLAHISGLDISTTSANASINTTQRCRLIKKADKTPINQVAGVMVDDLKQYRSYNIVADGELVVKEIPVSISTKQAFEALLATGLLRSGDTKAKAFKAGSDYRVSLEGLLVTKLLESAATTFDAAIRQMFYAKVIANLINSILAEKSADFTGEQIAELKKHYLSKSLFLNFPTTNEYTDLQEAIKAGRIDVQSSYKVTVGVDGILGFDSFRSSNEFLDRMYIPEGWGKDKVKCPLLLDKQTWTKKALSKKASPTLADAIQEKIFDAVVLGIKSPDDLVANIGKVISSFHVAGRWTPSSKDAIENLTSAQRALNKYADEIYMKELFPVVFFIGAFGMAPDNWDAKAMCADDLKKVWPDVKLGKADADGIFYVVGNCAFEITSEKRYVTIDR
jgi:hypothetical protein